MQERRTSRWARKVFEIITRSHHFEAVKKALVDAKIDTRLAEVILVRRIRSLDEKAAEQMLKLMEVLTSMTMFRRYMRISIFRTRLWKSGSAAG